MRRPLLIACALMGGLAVSAQTLLFEDDFDNLTAGMGVAEQNSGWETWDGSAGVDAEVSTDYASSGANSAKIEGTGVDLVLPIGPYTSGKYDVIFKMFLPTGGTGGYFNALHQWSSSTTTYEWAVDVFFNAAGLATWTAAFVEGGDAQMPINEWFDVQITADLDEDMGYLYLDGTMVHSWTWSIDNADGTPGTNQIAGVDFYGTNTAGTAGLYYIDDVELWNSTGVIGITTVEKTEPVFFPNPATDNLNISLPESWTGAQLQILDLTGKIVLERKNIYSLNSTFNVSALSEGIYLVKLQNGEIELTRKLVIKN